MGRSPSSKRARASVLLLLALFCAACTPISYDPVIQIPVSAEKMPLRIEVHDLLDASPPEDRVRRWGGSSATSPDSLPGALPTLITDALVSSVRMGRYFEEFRRRPEHPGLVLSGTIRRLRARSYIHPAAWATLLVPLIVGAPLRPSRVDVDLEIAFDTPDGRRVASYAATKSYSSWDTSYERPELEIGDRLNEVLTSAVTDLLEQIVADRARLLQAAAGPRPASQ